MRRPTAVRRDLEGFMVPILVCFALLAAIGALICVYVLVIEVFVYRDLGIRRDLPRIIVASMTMLGALMAILTTAVGFTGWLIQAEIPTLLFDLMDEHVETAIVFLLALNVFLVLIGMLTDGMTAIVVVAPLVLPLAVAYGIDPFTSRSSSCSISRSAS
jgi:TRAP-type C4-dicarboxylate transport system permease large subunit